MKISMIELVSSHGGMNYYDYGLMNSFDKLGQEVTLFTSCSLKFDTYKNNNLSIKLTYKNLFNTKNKLKQFCIFILGTIKTMYMIKKSDSKIVHFQIFAISYLEFFIVLISKLLKLKIVVTVHDVESFNKENDKKLTERFYKKTDAIIVHNNVSYETIMGYLKNLNVSEKLINNCNIVHHGSYVGLLPAKIEKSIAKKKFNITSETFVFLFFGQIKKIKGLDILLEAYAKLLKKTKKTITLIVAGKIWKDEVSIYQKIIEEYNLSEHLIMNIKYIPDEDVVYYYSAADCIVLPYKKIFQSGVLLMAQSYNVPVIVSDLRGMTEIVQNEKNGFVFKSEDSNSLCDVMNTVIDYPDLTTLQNNSFSILQKEYNWDSIAKQQVAIMEKIVKE